MRWPKWGQRQTPKPPRGFRQAEDREAEGEDCEGEAKAKARHIVAQAPDRKKIQGPGRGRP
jgi:hypothetical protein